MKWNWSYSDFQSNGHQTRVNIRVTLGSMLKIRFSGSGCRNSDWMDHKVGWEIQYLISNLIVLGGRRRCYPFWNPRVWTVSSVAEECATRWVLSPSCSLYYVLRNIAWGWRRWSRSLSVVSPTEMTLCNSNSSNCLRPWEWRGQKRRRKRRESEEGDGGSSRFYLWAREQGWKRLVWITLLLEENIEYFKSTYCVSIRILNPWEADKN